MNKCVVMNDIVFATNNSHKLEELRQIVGEKLNILSLNDIGCHDDIPENEPTLQGNAIAKARWVKDRYGYNCFADDTGLEVDALNGEPGVYSARYAGPEHDSQANMKLLLKNLAEVPMEQRTAHFTTVIALTIDDETHLFEGRVDGHILTAPDGDGGFGYDPIFQPEGWKKSFAQATSQEKNAISHRGRATRALLNYLMKL
jgi:XTP/dITP diphosphohydrolase